MSLFITYKKKREKTQKISYFLLKSFAVSNKSSTFASSIRQRGYSLDKISPLYTYCKLATCDATTLPTVEGRNDGKVTCPLCSQPMALAKMQACKVSEDKQKAIIVYLKKPNENKRIGVVSNLN